MRDHDISSELISFLPLKMEYIKNKPDLDIPRARHFCNLQYWHLFLV
jgi:hypothetical protein